MFVLNENMNLVDDLNETAVILCTVENNLERESVGVEVIAALHFHPPASDHVSSFLLYIVRAAAFFAPN
jgi:hypothetical protein